MDEQASEAGEGRRLSEFEQEALFQEWVQKSLGTNPDKMDDDAYSTSFETFKTQHVPRPAGSAASESHAASRTTARLNRGN